MDDRRGSVSALLDLWHSGVGRVRRKWLPGDGGVPQPSRAGGMAHCRRPGPAAARPRNAPRSPLPTKAGLRQPRNQATRRLLQSRVCPKGEPMALLKEPYVNLTAFPWTCRTGRLRRRTQLQSGLPSTTPPSRTAAPTTCRGATRRGNLTAPKSPASRWVLSSAEALPSRAIELSARRAAQVCSEEVPYG